MEQIIPQPSQDYKVVIKCLTYNQEDYIEDALKGFVMQKTDFPFCALIVDDFSTDNTAQIIRKFEAQYPDIIKGVYLQENYYSQKKNKNILLKPWFDRCEYIALCEGDDYWIDPMKLQRQVSFLDANPDYTMCFHAVNYEENRIITGNDRRSEIECDFPANKLIHEGGLFCATTSLLFRSQYYLNDMPLFRKMAIASGVGDSPLQALLAIRGKIHYFPEIMGCYRYGSNGSWTSANRKQRQRIYDHYRTSIAWYKELDNYTNGKYRNDVYYKICALSIDLYHEGQMKFFEVVKNLNKMSWNQEKRAYVKTFLHLACPYLFRIYGIILKLIK